MAGYLTHIVAIIGLFAGPDSQIKVKTGGWQLQSTDVGKEYGVVRRNLIREGNVPVDQDHSSQVCFLSDTECSMYPELSGCAIDQGRPCRFEWQSASGLRFHIITNGENSKHLIVQGMDYDEKVPWIHGAYSAESDSWALTNSGLWKVCFHKVGPTDVQQSGYSQQYWRPTAWSQA